MKGVWWGRERERSAFMWVHRSIPSRSISKENRCTSRPTLLWELLSSSRTGTWSRWTQREFSLRRKGSTSLLTNWWSFRSILSQESGGRTTPHVFTWSANKHIAPYTYQPWRMRRGVFFMLYVIQKDQKILAMSKKSYSSNFGDTYQNQHLHFFEKNIQVKIKKNAYIGIDNGNLIL